ncbi:MAG TPA: response regulator transcription factor [Actinomycetota bacterium]|nr:response regulator transcription factor [Actinomycetota bacterium]
MGEKIKVLVVDDHAVVREGVRMVLETDPDLKVVGEAGSGEEAIEMARELSPDVVVMDIGMPGLSGFEATRRIRAAQPEVKVLALTVHDSEAYLFQMLQAGAVGYVLKRAAAADLIQAVKAAHRGETLLHPSVARLLIKDYLARAERGEEASGERISEREREILKLIAEGKTNREIASMLYLSVKTVQAHRASLMRKLGLHDRVELVKYAIRKGIVGLDEI